MDERVARTAFRWLSERWQLTAEEQTMLLGLVQPAQPERIAQLIRVYDKLHRLFDGDAGYADVWIRTPNSAFAGHPGLVSQIGRANAATVFVNTAL